MRPVVILCRPPWVTAATETTVIAAADVGLQFLRLAQRDPLRSITPGPQLLDVSMLRRAIGFGLPFQTAAAVPPRRGIELVSQRRMRLHAGDIQIVIGFRRFFVRIAPGETDAGGATAD